MEKINMVRKPGEPIKKMKEVVDEFLEVTDLETDTFKDMTPD